ncbi:hypothetical protein TNIN_116921 [Trichonephila inaurata madagascariensis]|uniref:Uncharacterized protein n=1 Tax=Trichonephila inaurata madagascariensis TaxID=2747483 RepID=A0A8X7CMM7_9ARAC|nr:hypothetical protein TNIN_116921 [Trichonephila inaurata madagascariensis]
MILTEKAPPQKQEQESQLGRKGGCVWWDVLTIALCSWPCPSGRVLIRRPPHRLQEDKKINSTTLFLSAPPRFASLVDHHFNGWKGLASILLLRKHLWLGCMAVR